jgi:hypothetical protein
MGIKMALFNVTKSLEDLMITLDRVAWQPKWTVDQKK